MTSSGNHCAEAAGAYTEWPPLGRIASSGLITQAAGLLASPDFQATAASLLRQLLQRKQGHVSRISCPMLPSCPEIWLLCFFNTVYALGLLSK